MRDSLRDIRLAARMLRRQPSFTVTAVVTLALAIGANVLVFAALNAIVWRPLPFNQSGQLVKLIENVPGEESPTGAPQRTDSMSPDLFHQWRTETRTLSDFGLMLPVAMTLRRDSGATRLEGWQVSAATL